MIPIDCKITKFSANLYYYANTYLHYYVNTYFTVVKSVLMHDPGDRILLHIASFSLQISYAEIQHEATSGVKVNMGNNPVVEYTQIA